MTTKTVYLFDPETNEYRGAYDCQVDPLEPEKFIEPTHCLTAHPPAVAPNEVAVAHNGAWEIRPDYRGAVGYTEAGEAVAVENIGDTLSSLGLLADAPPAPPPAPPSACTRRQGRLALLEQGLLDDVENSIDAIADPLQKRQAQIEYEADTWERGNAFLQAMWTQLGGTPEGMDDLFARAVTL